MFVPKEPIYITLDGEASAAPPAGIDTIAIKPRMDVATKACVMDAFAALTNATPGAYQLALLTHNIVNWAGPSFDGVACTHAAIGALDPEEPLVVLALRSIQRRNRARVALSPKSPTTSSSTNAGVPVLPGDDATRSATTTAPSS